MSLHKISFPADAPCNVTDDVILQQVARNIKRRLPQAKPYLSNDVEVALVCGGPSLAQTELELVQAWWNGAKVVCVNGSYQWCIERNIKPSAVVMLDAREFNKRFVATAVPGCRYLLASQCHPASFDLVEGRDVTIWHACSAGKPELDLLKAHYGEECYPVTLGTTVAIRAISLLRMLGFQSFDIFGLDSCWLGDRHHAYAQNENDNDKYIETWLRPRGRDDLAQRFYCAPWMMQQAEDFQRLIVERGDRFRLHVRGDGLIATMMKIAAELGSVPIVEER
ncbi:MAG TPA: 6-hydroxymethylpterin diphosphokinase MptE-like protein [Anaerolineae bacterium]|nr:6-hydroxymethylpterin diphosphokinase MptE-like protein [Anaerolineae bacterium]